MKYIIFLVIITLKGYSQDTTNKGMYSGPKVGKSYWNKHIYSPNRLVLLKKYAQYTGRITKVYREKDGDLHVYVSNGRDTLLCEVICQRIPKFSRAISACAGYDKRFPKLSKGMKVRMKGPLVYDKYHRWKEIHPVKSIVIFKSK